jgi:hypothetical protein
MKLARDRLAPGQKTRTPHSANDWAAHCDWPEAHIASRAVKIVRDPADHAVLTCMDFVGAFTTLATSARMTSTRAATSWKAHGLRDSLGTICKRDRCSDVESYPRFGQVGQRACILEWLS